MSKESVFDMTHQTILETATTLFLENGFKNTSTRDIASVAKITQPALYYHFSNKEILFIEVNKQIGAQLNSKIKTIQKEPISLEEKLEKVTQVFLEIYHRDIFSFIHQSAADMDTENKFQLFDLLDRYYIKPIQEIFESSDVFLNQKIDAKKAAHFYLMSLSLLFTNAHQMFSEAEQATRISDLIHVILHGILS